MVEPPSPSAIASEPAGRRWGASAAAAAWPTLCALAVAAYAFFPARFPERTGLTLAVLVAVEFPMILLGVLHAAALAEPTATARLKVFGSGVLVLALLAVLYVGLDAGLTVIAPTLFWVLVPMAIDLGSHHADPALASRQAAAVVEDRLHLISLIPSLVVFGVLLAIATVLLLAGISIAFGTDLVGKLGAAFERADPALFALAGSAYLLIGAASAAHVHRPVFLRTGKAFLDRGWIHQLSLKKR